MPCGSFRNKEMRFTFQVFFLRLCLRHLPETHSHPQPKLVSLVSCLIRCGKCDTLFAFKRGWELTACGIKRMSPGQRQSTDSKVAVWSLGPQPAEEFQDFSLVSALFLIKDMTIIIRVLLFLSLTSTALLFPYNSLQKEPRVEFESSGSSSNEPVQGIIKVVQLDPGRMSPSMFFRRGLPHRRAVSPRSRVPFPAFLSRGRPGLASAPRAPVSPLHNLSPQSTSEMELKKKQGLHMWQKVIDKGDKMTLPVNLKDTKQTCTAVSFEQVSVCFDSIVFLWMPKSLQDFIHVDKTINKCSPCWQMFTLQGWLECCLLVKLLPCLSETWPRLSSSQHVTADGCQTVRVHNKLCFGQCSSLFVPSEGEVAEPGPGTGAFHHRAPCTRCAPVKARTVTVPLRCGAGVREKRVMVVEECKCETSREQRAAEAAASTHLWLDLLRLTPNYCQNGLSGI